MTTKMFPTYINNALRVNADGSGQVNFVASSFPIVPGSLYGAPSNLQELITLVGPLNILINYYILAQGTVSKHDCWIVQQLNATGKLTDGTESSNIPLAKTSEDPSGETYIGTGWIPFMINATTMLSQITTNNECFGNQAGCGICAFEYYGGWNNIYISVRADVFVNMYNYCTTGPSQNISQDMCYKYLGDFIGKNGTTPQITAISNNYCINKFPGGNLSVFNDPNNIDPRDYNICACNFPDQYYKQLEQSLATKFPNLTLGPLQPNCLLPSCMKSNFKAESSCQVPQCFTNLTINDDNTVKSYELDESVDCSGYGITTKSPVIPIPSPAQNITFWTKYKWLIIVGGILLLVLLILLIILAINSD